MEKVIERYATALQTLSTLKNALDKIERGVPAEYALEVRDSAMQRFKYSFDTFWKFLKIYLRDVLKMPTESESPRGVIKEALSANILSLEEFNMLMDSVTSRNETSHAYNELIAESLVYELPEIYELLHTILVRIKPN